MSTTKSTVELLFVISAILAVPGVCLGTHWGWTLVESGGFEALLGLIQVFFVPVGLWLTYGYYTAAKEKPMPLPWPRFWITSAVLNLAYALAWIGYGVASQHEIVVGISNVTTYTESNYALGLLLTSVFWIWPLIVAVLSGRLARRSPLKPAEPA